PTNNLIGSLDLAKPFHLFIKQPNFRTITYIVNEQVRYKLLSYDSKKTFVYLSNL
ncbi:MAG: hypothetical protein FD167_1361, partial [bacterium]